MTFKQKLFTVYVFAKLNTRRFFRDKLAIFFGIMFPLIFLFVFGGIFGNNSSGGSFNIALINQSKSQYAQDFAKDFGAAKGIKVDKDISNEAQAQQKMSRSQLDATIILPSNFGEARDGKPAGQARVVYTQNNAQAGQQLVQLLNAQIAATNRQLTGAPELFSVKGEQSNQRSLTQVDYVFAGLLGFAIIGMGIFGPVNVFPELKKQGILRRFHTTPLRVWQYFTATMISQALIGLASLAVTFIVAMAVFKLKVVGNYFELIVFLILSIVMILGIGLAIGGWAKNERQAAPLSNIVVFPMMFLSGTFFPRYAMPEWLQNASGWLPLTPVIDGIRLLATEGRHPIDLGPQLGLMALWLVVIYFIAFRLFRWE